MDGGKVSPDSDARVNLNVLNIPRQLSGENKAVESCGNDCTIPSPDPCPNMIQYIPLIKINVFSVKHE